MSIPNQTCDGLIFRINSLWKKVDKAVLDGDYELWDKVLDRVYGNLTYKGKTVFLKDKKGIIISSFDDDEEEYKYGYSFLSEKVDLLKQLNKNGVTKGRPNKKIVRRLWHQAPFYLQQEPKKHNIQFASP